jgi:integrase/recombinase XerD
MIKHRIIIKRSVSKLVNGKYPVYLRLTYSRKSKLFFLNLHASEEEWSKDFDRFTKKAKNYRARNERLNLIEQRAEMIIQKLMVLNQGFSFTEFEDHFFETERNQSIMELFDKRIAELVNREKYSTSEKYKSTRNVLENHLSIKYKPMPEILSKEHLMSFEIYLRKKGNNEGGIHHHMKNIRAIINMAIRDKELSPESYPFMNNFNRNGYSMASLKPSPTHRALSEKDMDKLKSFDYMNHPSLAESYLYFMFSYYARGMNFIDMAKLKKSDLVRERITYIRTKTGELLSIPISDNLRKILDEFSTDSGYVFPILSSLHQTERQIQDRKKKVLARTNRNLKKIGQILSLEIPLTTYVARHTYATTLNRKNAPIGAISQALGHADIKTTEAYLAKFGDKEIDKLDNLL